MADGRSRFIEAERAIWSRYGIEPLEYRLRQPAGNEVRIQEVGTGPAVVFVHGATVAGTSWVVLADALEDDVRCILVDRPGCGLSDPVPGGPLTTASDFTRFAGRFVPDLLDSLELDEAPVACTSMGAFFGFRAAIAHPDRITRLVSYSWPMGSPMAKVPMMMRLGSPPPLKAVMKRMPVTARGVRMMLRQVGMVRAVETGTFDDDMVEWTVAIMAHTDTLASELDNNTFVSLRGANPELLFTDAELQCVDVPVLLLWGTEDTNAGVDQARAFAARLPDATLDIVEEAGHAPWIDQPARCAGATRDFLRS